jgi:hypothetical protein
MTTYRLLPGSSEPSRKRSTRMGICCATLTAKGCRAHAGESGRHFVEKGSMLVPPPLEQPDTRGMDQNIADLADS